MGAGEQISLGIVIDLDARGVVTGVNLAENAVNRATRSIQQATSQVQNHMYGIGQGLRIMSRGVAVAGASLVGMGEIARRGILAPAISEFEDYNLQATQLEMVSGRVGDEFQRMRDHAFQMAMETKFSAGEATEAMTALRRAGLSAETALSSLRPVLDFSTISAGTVTHMQAVQSLLPAYNKLKNTTGETFREILDSYAFMQRETNLSPENMRPLVNSFGALAREANLSSVEMFGLGGMMRDIGRLPAEAASQLAQLHGRLVDLETRRGIYADPEGRVRGGRKMMMARLNAMEKLGISMFEGGEQRQYVDVLADIVDGLDNVNTEQERMQLGQLLFGRQARGVIMAFRDYEKDGLRGADAIRHLFQMAGDSAGESQRQVELYNRSLRGMKELALGAWRAVGTLLGEGLMPLLEPAVYYFWQLGQRLQTLLQQFPALRSVISFAVLSFIVLTITTGTLTLALAGLLMVAAAVAGGLAALTYAVGTLSAVLSILGYAILPILALGLAFAGGIILMVAWIGVFVAAYMKNLGGFADWVDDWVDKITTLWEALVDFFGAGNSEAITEELHQRLRDVGMLEMFLFTIGLIRRLEEAWYGIKDVLDVVGPVISGILSVVVGVITWAIDGIIWLFSLLGYKFDEDMEYWRSLGQIIGVVLVVAIGALTLATLALSAAFAGLLALLFISALPTILMFAIGIGTVWGIIAGGLYIIDLLRQGFNAAWEEWARMQWVQDLKDSLEVAKVTVEGWILWLDGKIRDLEVRWNDWLDSMAQGARVFEPLADLILTLMNPLALLGTIFDIDLDVSSAGNMVTSFLQGLVENVASFNEAFENAGNALIESFKRGVESAWDDLVSGWGGLMQRIRDYLPSSDAQVGPLSTLTQSGMSLITTLQSGMMTAMPNLITSLTQGLSGISGLLGIGPTPTEGGEGRIGGIVPLSPIQSVVNAVTGGGAEGAGGGGGRTVNVNVGGIKVQVMQATEEEAERLATQIMDRIRSEMDMEMERSFA